MRGSCLLVAVLRHWRAAEREPSDSRRWAWSGDVLGARRIGSGRRVGDSVDGEARPIEKASLSDPQQNRFSNGRGEQSDAQRCFSMSSGVVRPDLWLSHDGEILLATTRCLLFWQHEGRRDSRCDTAQKVPVSSRSTSSMWRTRAAFERRDYE